MGCDRVYCEGCKYCKLTDEEALKPVELKIKMYLEAEKGRITETGKEITEMIKDIDSR